MCLMSQWNWKKSFGSSMAVGYKKIEGTVEINRDTKHIMEFKMRTLDERCEQGN